MSLGSPSLHAAKPHSATPNLAASPLNYYGCIFVCVVSSGKAAFRNSEHSLARFSVAPFLVASQTRNSATPNLAASPLNYYGCIFVCVVSSGEAARFGVAEFRVCEATRNGATENRATMYNKGILLFHYYIRTSWEIRKTSEAVL
jgi:hypothetical protein